MRWAECTFEELAGLEQRRTVALLPVGAVEAHGPHLPVSTDGVIASAMVDEAARHVREAGLQPLILPPLEYTPAPFAADFPGTISLSPETMRGLVVEVALGALRVATLLAIGNAHFDPANLQALEQACAQLGPRAICPNLTRRRYASRLGDEFLSGACHAGSYESSLVLAHQPQLVREGLRQGLQANPVSLSQAIRAGQTSFAQAGGPRAYFGDPAAASAGEGRQRSQELGLILWEAIRDALAG